ncbi:MAG: class I SAM-dependent methyltransferase, partial [Myxococcota bacterium]
TGFFLDQRANRQRVARLAAGKRVLNVFGYTGGFSLAAALQGAARTTTVDLSAPALEDAKAHFERNGLSASAHEFIPADAFDYLGGIAARPGGAPFEVAVCDPPSFAHRRKDLGRAKAAYARLFGALLRGMPDHATVVLASCSSHVSRSTFLEIVGESALAAGVSLVLGEVCGADVDHPTLPGFPQGEYLKCVYATVSRD